MIGTAGPSARAVQAFADARGESFRAVVLHALCRHLRSLPPSEPEPAEPLPDSPNAAPAGARKRRQPRKASG